MIDDDGKYLFLLWQVLLYGNVTSTLRKSENMMVLKYY